MRPPHIEQDQRAAMGRAQAAASGVDPVSWGVVRLLVVIGAVIALVAAPAPANAMSASGLLAHPSPVSGDLCGARTITQGPTSDKSHFGGENVIAIGDLNGDGRSDVVMGCPFATRPGHEGSGETVVFLRASGNEGYDTPVVLVDRTAARAGCGRSVRIADVDADGRQDVLVSCSLVDASGVGANGVLHIYRRSATRSGFLPAEEIGVEEALADARCFGHFDVGDLDGNGSVDIAAGCISYGLHVEDGGGVLPLLRNSANNGYVAQPVLVSSTPGYRDRCGYDIEVGDVNADGRGDIVAGCPNDEHDGATNGGTALVFQRNSTNDGFEPPLTLGHPAAGSGDYCRVVGLGDVNRDHHQDVVFGCDWDDVDGSTNAGSVVVVRRNSSNTGFTGGTVLAHPVPRAGDLCGSAVILADVDADGADDVLFGCAYGDVGSSLNAGAMVTYRGVPGGGFTSAVMADWPSPVAGEHCGVAIAGGDIDADGDDDVVTSCPGAAVNGVVRAGAARVFGASGSSVPAGPTGQIDTTETVKPDPAPTADPAPCSADPCSTGPVQPRQTLISVAIGDSYSSGEGAGKGPGNVRYFTGDHGRNCHRSPAAWPLQIPFVAALAPIPRRALLACSGATTKDIRYVPQKGKMNVAQLDLLRQIEAEPDTSIKYITVTAGGNDAGFSKLATKCVASIAVMLPCSNRFIPKLYVGRIESSKRFTMRNPARDCFYDGDKDDISHDSRGRIAVDTYRLERRLACTYWEIQRVSPRARLVVATYPRVISGDAREANRFFGRDYCIMGIARMYVRDVVYLDRIQGAINRSISRALATARPFLNRPVYVDMTSVTRGHELCGKGTPWIHPILGKFSFALKHNESVHPTVPGLRAMGARADAALTKDNGGFVHLPR